MLKLSPAAELAVRGVVVLAERHGQGPLSISAVCQARGLGKEYLTKIFSSLSRAGLLKPVRGKGGGYMLSRSPSQISLLQVIEAVEGPLAMNLCQQTPPQCEESDCPMRGVWCELQQIVHGRLSRLTLSECIRPAVALGGNGNGHSGELAAIG